MKRKSVIFVIVGIILAQLILLAFVNAMYYLRSGIYITEFEKWYMWDYIIYIALNESVVFTVGILIFFKNHIRKSKKVFITTVILIFSLILLFASGIYFGITMDSNINTNFIKYMDLYINVFYIVFAVSFIVFTIFSIIDKVVTKRLQKLLLGLVIGSIIVLYFRQNIMFGWISEFSTNYDTRKAIRIVFDYIVVYPLNISIYIVFAIVLINDYKHVQSIDK
ncbi:MAG: hypothetical protein KQ78_01189 [Candidatus Izimaplasma bacterium HR2]|nr:MAG: hypothetical protein KQ78_01189 [Candidatus Izimaplasma bacterium HR2]